MGLNNACHTVDNRTNYKDIDLAHSKDLRIASCFYLDLLIRRSIAVTKKSGMKPLMVGTRPQ
jgi:hypothetical protein